MFSACGGREALSRLQSDRPDLVLLDVLILEMDGLEVCHYMTPQIARAKTKIEGDPTNPKYIILVREYGISLVRHAGEERFHRCGAERGQGERFPVATPAFRQPDP